MTESATVFALICIPNLLNHTFKREHWSQLTQSCLKGRYSLDISPPLLSAQESKEPYVLGRKLNDPFGERFLPWKHHRSSLLLISSSSYIRASLLHIHTINPFNVFWCHASSAVWSWNLSFFLYPIGLIHILSIESQKGIITVQTCSVENQKGAIYVQSLWR